jgi:hypothetical protein
MSLLDLFRPKWKHSKWAVRAKAVDALEDQAILLQIAKNDPERVVKERACARIKDIAEIRKHADADPVFRIELLERRGTFKVHKRGTDYYYSFVTLEGREKMIDLPERTPKLPVAIQTIVLGLTRDLNIPGRFDQQAIDEFLNAAYERHQRSAIRGNAMSLSCEFCLDREKVESVLKAQDTLAKILPSFRSTGPSSTT